MALIGGPLAAAILRGYTWHDKEAKAYESRSKVETLLGPQVWDAIRDKVVLDFGCGNGSEALEMASRGAREVIGLDIRENALAVARAAQDKAGIKNCLFFFKQKTGYDIVTSLDAFEHFGDPEGIL